MCVTLPFLFNQPTYLLQMWTGRYFERTTLKKIGLRLQLGHCGGPCPMPGRMNSKMIVGDVTGFHEVRVCFCSCYSSDGSCLYVWQQLLQLGWFPATHNRPTTVFTFHLLIFLHQLNLQVKTSLYDFHRTLWRVTDNSQLLHIV